MTDLQRIQPMAGQKWILKNFHKKDYLVTVLGTLVDLDGKERVVIHEHRKTPGHCPIPPKLVRPCYLTCAGILLGKKEGTDDDVQTPT